MDSISISPRARAQYPAAVARSAPTAPLDTFVPSGRDVQDDLRQAVHTVLAQDSAMNAAQWGLVVQDADGQVLFDRGADKLLMPASTLKLVTGAAALARLGPDASFPTRLVAGGKVDPNGTLQGNLYLVGGGDPTLSTDDLRDAVKKLPLRKVEGNLVVDDRVFDDHHLGRGWSWDNLSDAYSAEVDGLMLDANVAHLNVQPGHVTVSPDSGYLTISDHSASGASTEVRAERRLGNNVVDVNGTVAAGESADVDVTVHDAGLYAGNVLRWLCHEQGIEVSGQVARGTSPQGPPLWENRSDDLLSLEHDMLKDSNNLYAETLFRALANGQSAQAPQLELQTLKVDEPCHIADGSGLSRENLVSPNLLSRTIREHYSAKETRDCLPVAGVDGTLRHRMPTLKGRVQAKTGTLDGVSTLAGWLVGRDGKTYSFAWMCNGYTDEMARAKRTEDALLVAIDGVLSKSTPACK